MRPRVVSAVIGEDEVQAVLGFTAPIVDAVAGELIVVHVARPFVPYLGPASAWGAALAAGAEAADALHLEAELVLAGFDAPWQFMARAGDPVTELLAAADEVDALFIALGRGTRTSAALCDALVRRARRPVVVVPVPGDSRGS